MVTAQFIQNGTITILAAILPVAAGLPTHISCEYTLCLLRVAPNDQLSLTNAILDAYGIG